jgi:hypothetical protein
LIPPEGFADLGFQWVKDIREFMKDASEPPLQTCLTPAP